MKKLKYIAVVAVALISLSSCNDAIDIVQPGELNDATIFKTTKDLENYLTGSVYTSLDISNQIKFSSVFTDEVKVGPANAGQDMVLFRYTLTSSDSYANAIWGGQYLTINRVNRLLRASETITPMNAAETTQFNNTLAEGRVMRALAYLNLMSYYSTNMKDDNGLGVIISNTVPDVYAQIPRSKNGDVWAAIEADLAFADANINPAYQLQATHTFPLFASKALISSVRARMYLYRGNYVLAKQYAESAITQSGLGLTLGSPIPTGTIGSAAWNTAFYGETTTNNPYRQMWADVNQGENIFSLGRLIGGTGGNIANIYTTNTTTITGSPWWVFGLNLFSNMTSNTNDIRRYAFVDPTSTAANQVYVIDKYPGKGNQPLKNNIKVFRLSEMYLILAECAAQQNDFAGAATRIKAIRDARKYTGTATLPVYTDKVSALRDILKERRVELAFEGHRYVDLRRLGAEAGVSIDRNAADDNNTATPLTLSITDHRFTLPIPSSELNGNPSIVQNPGY